MQHIAPTAESFDLHNLAFNSPLKSVQPRWERVQHLQKQPASPSKITSAASRFAISSQSISTSDRYIPNYMNSTCVEKRSDLVNINSPGSSSGRILTYKQKAPESQFNAFSRIQNHPLYVAKSAFSRYNQSKSKQLAGRTISPAPERILDAPGILDDYYLNLIDWSSTNLLAVALGDSVFIWNAKNGTVEQLMSIQDDSNTDYICSVSWMNDGCHLAIGLSDGNTQIYEAETKKKLRTMSGHSARVSSLAWNGCILSSGSRDSSIVNHDVRVARHNISSFNGHSQEVCGLKWSPLPVGSHLQLASGGNDNVVRIWDLRYKDATNTFTEHQAAVKVQIKHESINFYIYKT